MAFVVFNHYLSSLRNVPGFACRLLTTDMRLIRIREKTLDVSTNVLVNNLFQNKAKVIVSMIPYKYYFKVML